MAAITALVKQALPSYASGTHMFSSQPITSLLPKEMQVDLRSPAGIRPGNPVYITGIALRDNRIVIDCEYFRRPISLSFSQDWRLEEMRLAGKPVDFNREESARGHAVWKKALEREIAETKE